MAKVKIHNKHDRAKLRAALDAAGFKKAKVAEGPEGLFVEVEDDQALEADLLAQRLHRKAIVEAVEGAKSWAEAKGPLVEVLKLLMPD